MKTAMKNNILRAIVFMMMIASFDACQKDTETDPAVSPADRDKFIGIWITQSTGTTPPLNFTMTIYRGTSSASQILIKNFEGEGSSTTTIGEISGNSISIPQQVVASDTIQGSGTYNNNNTLTLNYTLRDGIAVDTRSATAHQ